MTGVVLLMSPCFGCGVPFAYNPHRVPSHRDTFGVRKPVCRRCIDLANPLRIQNGLPPIVPHPEAYEPLPENEL